MRILFKILGIGCVGALSFAAQAAHASVIGAEGLKIVIGGGAHYVLFPNNDFNPSNPAMVFENNYYFRGVDFRGTQYFNKSISLKTQGSARFASAPVKAGTVISVAPSSRDVTFDSQTASFRNEQVSPGYSVRCGFSVCYRPPQYGLVGSYTTDNADVGSHLFLPASYKDKAGVTELGYLDLSITLNDSNKPYSLILNGYAFETTGRSILAGQGLTKLSPVPLPPSWALMAMGFLGLGCVGPMRSAARRQALRRSAGA